MAGRIALMPMVQAKSLCGIAADLTNAIRLRDQRLSPELLTSDS